MRRRRGRSAEKAERGAMECGETLRHFERLRISSAAFQKVIMLKTAGGILTLPARQLCHTDLVGHHDDQSVNTVLICWCIHFEGRRITRIWKSE